MKLYIVRHGQCEWNALRKVCGSTDSPLTEKGRALIPAFYELTKWGEAYLDDE